MGETINLDSKYAKKVQQAFTEGSLVQGRLENDLEFVGAKTVKVHTVVTVPLNDYKRSGANRYGVPKEVEDFVQELTMKEDKAFSTTIDKGNSKDQAINKAGQFLALEMKEQVVPYKDRYTLKKLAQEAGKTAGYTEKITEENVVRRMSEARAYMKNNRVPLKGRTWYVTTEVYNALLAVEKQFVGIEKLVQKSFVNGQVGMIFGAPVVEVPDDLMPEGVNFMLVHKSAACAPAKISDSKLHMDPPGISGNLCEGRFYFDVFVFGAKAAGIYVDVDAAAATVLEAPVINAATGAIKAAEGCSVRYTLDGSDPRYSVSAQTGPTAVGGKKGDTVKACQEKEGCYRSGVSEVKLTADIA